MKINEQVDNTKKVLLQAAMDGNTLLFKLLLEHFLMELALPIEEIVDLEYGGNALHWAALNGNLYIVKILVEKFPSLINTKSQNNSTPILNAAIKGHVEVTYYLAQNGADLSITNDRKENICSVAAKKPDNDPIKIYFQDYQNLLNKNFFEAVSNQQQDLVTELLAKGANIEAPMRKSDDDKIIYTALFHACSIGDTGLAKFLIDKKANINVIGAKNKFTPLHAAVFFGHEEIVKLLIKAGAVHSKDANDQTPLELARSRDLKNMIAILDINPIQISSSKQKDSLKLNETKRLSIWSMPSVIKDDIEPASKSTVTLEKLKDKINSLPISLTTILNAGQICITQYNAKCSNEDEKVDLTKFEEDLKPLEKKISTLKNVFDMEDINSITHSITQDYILKNAAATIKNTCNKIYCTLEHKIIPSQEYLAQYQGLFDNMRKLEKTAKNLENKFGKIYMDEMEIISAVSNSIILK